MNYIALWIGVCFCVPTFMLVNSLWLDGCSFWQMLGIILAGSLIMSMPMSLLAFIGYKYSLGFTEIIYQLFAKKCADLIILMRGLVCAGWFGINIYLVGSVISDFLLIRLDDNSHSASIIVNGVVYACIALLNIIMASKINVIQKVESISSVLFVFFILFSLATFVLENRTGCLSAPCGRAASVQAVNSIFLVFSYWSGFAANIPDYSKYARGAASAVFGNIFGICIGMTSASVVAMLLGIAASQGQAEFVWNPLDALNIIYEEYYSPLVSLPLLFIFMSTTNIAANCHPAMKCIAAVISQSRFWSSIILFTASALLCPWFMVSSHSSYAWYWINLYGLFLLPLIGIMATSFGKGIPAPIVAYSETRSILYFGVCFICVAIYMLMEANISGIGAIGISLTALINILLEFRRRGLQA